MLLRLKPGSCAPRGAQPRRQQAAPVVRWHSRSQLAAQHVQVAAAAEPAEAAGEQDKAPLPAAQALMLTFSEVEKLWVGVDRTLLSIGARGVTDKHANSLAELLRAHTLVKVKFNGSDADVGGAAEQLAQGGPAQLLQVKGKTALFATGEIASKKLLLSAASAKLEQHQKFQERKQLQREERQMQRSHSAEVRTAKATRDAAASRRRVDRAISSSTGKGPITKEGLLGEWDQIVDKLSGEGEEEKGGRGGRAEKRPWKK